MANLCYSMDVLHTMQFRSTTPCLHNAIKTPLKPFSIHKNLRTKPLRAFSALPDEGQNQNKNNKKTKPSAKSEAFREKLKNTEGNGRLDWITEPSVQRLIAELDDEGNKKSKKKGKAEKYYYERKGEDDYNDDDLVVEEEDESWWSDDLEYAEERWRPRASEYFKEPKIRNVIDENGRMIDWLGESNDEIIQEITSMEYEATAYHPSPLIILVFERYQRISENWDTLKELEKAFKVYWHSPEKLPPRIVKVDSKIDPDLASALGVKYPPQILFLGGKKILYREAESRTADQLVKMIAHFYYNAKRPDWINLAYYNR